MPLRFSVAAGIVQQDHQEKIEEPFMVLYIFIKAKYKKVVHLHQFQNQAFETKSETTNMLPSMPSAEADVMSPEALSYAFRHQNATSSGAFYKHV